MPQGSVLSPLLFLIFINDFPQCSEFFKFNLFADDSTLSCSFNKSDLNEIGPKLNTELDLVNNWVSSNCLKLNTSKSSFIAYSYRNRLEIPNICINNSVLQQADSVKFLGIFIDHNLRFNFHSNHIRSKLSKYIGILHRLKFTLPYSALLTIYNSLVLPHITYGIEIWYSAPKYIKDQIFILQKKAVRAIHALPWNSHTHEYFKMSKLLKLEDLYKVQACVQIFQALNSNDHIFINHVRTHQNQSNRTSRYSQNLVLPSYIKSHSQSGFIFSAISIWNSLPIEIRSSRTLVNFKSKIKQHFLSKY